MEDISLLSNLCGLKEINGIFDTQIAHRMCYEDEFSLHSSGTRNSSISLNELLKLYCNYDDNNIKNDIHALMSRNPYLWKTRPISDELNFYAGNDVLFLPKLYDIFCVKCGNKSLKNTNVTKILDECSRYLKYVNINLNIKNFNKMNLERGTEIQGLIK